MNLDPGACIRKTRLPKYRIQKRVMTRTSAPLGVGHWGLRVPLPWKRAHGRGTPGGVKGQEARGPLPRQAETRRSPAFPPPSVDEERRREVQYVKASIAPATARRCVTPALQWPGKLTS